MPSKKTRTPPPVTSFGPEIMAALLRGSKERFEIPMPYRDAIKFTMRIHSLRHAMRTEGHEQVNVVSMTKVRVLWGERAGLPPVPERKNSRNVPYPENSDIPAKVVIEPHDREFAQALIAAGIKADELKADPLLDFTPSPNTNGTVPDADDYLDQVLSSKKTPGV